jgi:hypothetical protein
MDALSKLSREAQVVLGGLVLFVIISFLDWQSVSIGPISYGDSLWHGFGVVVALVAIVFLLWEIGRLLNYNIELGDFTPGMISAVLALVLLVFTVIIFLDWSDFRSWPEWVGLILAVVIGVASFFRARAEGVEMPKMPANVSVGGSGSSGGAAASTGAPAAPPAAESPAPPDDAGSSGSTEA